MLARSELTPKLQEFIPSAGGETAYSLYGDPAYPHSLYVFDGYRNPPPGSDQARWNTDMSKVCKVVEWGFANLILKWLSVTSRHQPYCGSISL
jgi:hypothetical protein